MRRHLGRFILVVLVAAAALWISLPDSRTIKLDFNNDGENDFELDVEQRLGLDLVGGLRVLLRADLPPGSYSGADLQQTANNVRRRIDALGVTEPTIEVLQGSGRILVELPGITDREQAIATIQQTALLEFVDFAGLRGQVSQFVGRSILTSEQVIINNERQANQRAVTAEATPEADAAPAEAPLVNPLTNQPFHTVMTGSGLQAAAAQIDPQGGGWLIQFELTPAGGEVFGPYTAANIGEPMAIVLDGVVLSAPTIQAELPTGGVITGQFTEEAAKTLALQLRSGALPIPLSVDSAETVGASLGQESIALSLRAGIIGVGVILTFMLLYYRIPGIAANLALLVFILLNLAAYKLIPVTLTLPAITGFLIGIGTAVDGNILIFERIKEELRGGADITSALESGFHRAWNSIRDSNLSTIIICGILFLFGQTPGASVVSGFAVTLALGLTINLFTAVVVTRIFLSIIVALLQKPLAQRQWLLGV
ncbi:MAG: protein translocase subunit SecD [Chloroflexota bacterium]|nr:MAG: protein translocase subunit SecD [Chloroflexota bacterium]